jgi:catechol 2,3-dioxygenase-like lactoylglutathione lyase family enzyme
MPGLLGVDHVGVAVPDLDAAIGFYTGVLGLVLTHRETNQDQQVEEAMLCAPGQAGGQAQVQLLAPTSPGSTLRGSSPAPGPACSSSRTAWTTSSRRPSTWPATASGCSTRTRARGRPAAWSTSPTQGLRRRAGRARPAADDGAAGRGPDGPYG